MTVSLLLGCTGGFLMLSALGIATARQRAGTFLVYGGALGVAAVALAASLSALLANSSSAIVLPLGIPWLGAHFRVDALSAFFLAVTDLGAAAASLFALGYGRHERAPDRVLPFYPAFLAGMNLVLLSDDAFTFLFSWEFMSLASWALVMAHHREAGNTRAGYIYLVMASFGTLMLLLAFGMLAGADGQYVFESIREGHRAPMLSFLVLALALIGAGSKAGLVPLHVWLPLAHPAAPSHVSALMSGVMTKVAIYAFVRITFDLVGDIDWSWSMVVLAAGAMTAVIGVLSALMQEDLKRLLAFSTVENVGIVFIGLGLALAFRSNGQMAAAALALSAALFHVLNHSLFKSLLFFGAGAILNATGERDLDRLGGLIHRMPLTAFAFLIGAAAISALPPLNGFVSEWVIFQSIFLSPALPQWGLRLMTPAIGAVLALAAALTAACFVRAFGIAFLGRARGQAAEKAKEADFFSLSAMLGLAALCAVAGVLPGLVIDAIAPVVRALSGGAMPTEAAQPFLALVPSEGSRNTYSGALIFLFVALSALVPAVAIPILWGRRMRRSPAWDCGFPDQRPATQYSAASFAQPMRRVFGGVFFRARERVDMPRPGEMSPARFRVVLRDLVWDTLYAPIASGVGFAAERLNYLQFLTIRRYLTLVFAALVFLLLVLAIWD